MVKHIPANQLGQVRYSNMQYKYTYINKILRRISELIALIFITR